MRKMGGKKKEILVLELPIKEMFMDIGQETVEYYKSIILNSGAVFINGPAGVYEKKYFEKGSFIEKNVAGERQNVVEYLFKKGVDDAGESFPDYLLQLEREGMDSSGCSPLAARYQK